VRKKAVEIQKGGAIGKNLWENALKEKRECLSSRREKIENWRSKEVESAADNIRGKGKDQESRGGLLRKER